jgi:hypothetical protein
MHTTKPPFPFSLKTTGFLASAPRPTLDSIAVLARPSAFETFACNLSPLSDVCMSLSTTPTDHEDISMLQYSLDIATPVTDGERRVFIVHDEFASNVAPRIVGGLRGTIGCDTDCQSSSFMETKSISHEDYNSKKYVNTGASGGSEGTSSAEGPAKTPHCLALENDKNSRTTLVSLPNQQDKLMELTKKPEDERLHSHTSGNLLQIDREIRVDSQADEHGDSFELGLGNVAEEMVGLLSPDSGSTDLINELDSDLDYSDDSHASGLTTPDQPPRISPSMSTPGEGSIAPTRTPSNGGEKRKRCTCNRSRCLKLYCECFSTGKLCLDGYCKCLDCANNGVDEHEADRTRAVQRLLKKKGEKAFRNTSLERKREVAINEGCRCVKSRCVKKYCECYAAGLVCQDHCKCEDCENNGDAPPPPIKRKRKSRVTKRRISRKREPAPVTDKTRGQVTPAFAISAPNSVLSVTNSRCVGSKRRTKQCRYADFEY